MTVALLIAAMLRAAPAASPSPTPPPEGISPDLLAVYQSLRPPHMPTTEPGEDPQAPQDDRRPGFGIGPFSFQPSLLVGYARADTSVEAPQPIEDSYLHVEPRLGSQIVLFDGRLRANYEPQIRMRSRFAKINRPSHEVNVGAEVPFASRFILRASEHYAVSTLDAAEVDPGQEYFFGLGRFARSDTGAGLEIEIGPRLSVSLGATLNRVRFQETTTFFDYDQRRGDAALRYLLTQSVTLRLIYGYEDVPRPPDRHVAQSSAHSMGISLEGELLPLLTGSIAAGYRRQEAPLAGAGASRYEGLAASVRLLKEFARGRRLTLSGGRTTHLSSFEDNAFYISSSLQAAIDAQLLLGLSGRAGGGYHWNAYRTVASAVGAPRQDRLYGWTAGLSRPLNDWSYLRVDYAWHRRDSNVPGLDNESTMLLAQFGISLFGASGQ